MNKNFKNFKNTKNFFALVIVLLFSATPFLVGAQDTTTNIPDTTTNNTSPTSISIQIKNPFKCSGDTCTIPGFINTILNSILLPIGGVVAVLMIMYAGFLYVTAGGDEGQIKKAHNALLWAVIGAAILLGAKVISDAIRETINQLK